jgi:hypothetical protein
MQPDNKNIKIEFFTLDSSVFIFVSVVNSFPFVRGNFTFTFALYSLDQRHLSIKRGFL